MFRLKLKTEKFKREIWNIPAET